MPKFGKETGRGASKLAAETLTVSDTQKAPHNFIDKASIFLTEYPPLSSQPCPEIYVCVTFDGLVAIPTEKLHGK